MHDVSSLPKVLKQKLQRQMDSMSAKKTIVTKRKQEEGKEPPSRKRKSFVYGVDQAKFHTEGGSDQEELFAELQIWWVQTQRQGRKFIPSFAKPYRKL